LKLISTFNKFDAKVSATKEVFSYKNDKFFGIDAERGIEIKRRFCASPLMQNNVF
jgi:hypothetical protein